MKLLECYIENFGRISATHYSFENGINCFVSDNGSGKSTLAAFIKTMLYGMSDTKKTSLEENERKHYLPWGGGICGGWLSFSIGDRTYRIERRFAPKANDDSFTLYDLSTGRESEDYSSLLGAEIFGIDADGFERTVFLSERTLSPASDNKTISAKLSDLVGCEGDLSEMDKALDRLDNERKFYKKKGDKGKISEIKAQIGRIGERLDEIERSELSLLEAEKRLYKIQTDVRDFEGRRDKLVHERAEAVIRLEKGNYEKQYRGMVEKLDGMEKERDELLLVFGGDVPDFKEIDNAAYSAAEAKSIENAVLESKASEEYLSLCQLLKGRIEKSEIERINDNLTAIRRLEERESDPRFKRAKEIFKLRAPDLSEIAQAEQALKGAKALSPILIVLCGAIALVGTALGALINPLLFILTALSAVGAIALLLRRGRSKRLAGEVNNFILSVCGEACAADKCGEILNEMRSLYELRGEVDESMRLQEKKDALAALAARFPEINCDCTQVAEELIKKSEALDALSIREEYRTRELNEKSAHAAKLRAQSKEFLEKHGHGGDGGFERIRGSLNRWLALCEMIKAQKEQMESFRLTHRLGETLSAENLPTLAEIDEERRTVDDRISALRGELSLTESLCRRLSAEIEEKDEVLARRADAEDELRTSQENYDIIIKTSEYLSKAQESMTAKYIGKTKEGFIRYTEVIGGSSGLRFDMNTDFEVSRIEGSGAKSIEAYSRGTRDLYSLASRLALVDSLYEGEKPFILLDDPFVAMDDSKTAAAISLLCEFANERQIIYFTCSESRAIK